MKPLAIVLLCFNATAQSAHWYDSLAGPYVAKQAPRVDFTNSPRIEDLLRVGNLYLSLSDAVALAVENNLDIEVQRLWVPIASSDVMRAKGGGTLRGITLTVQEVPPGIGGPATPLLNAAASGSLPTTTIPTGLIEETAITPTTSGISITGASGFSAGPAIPPFDPAIVGNLQWQRQTTPETTTLASGTPILNMTAFSGSLGVQKGLSLGTLVSLTYDATRETTNSANSLLNPYTSSSLGLSLTQPLLRGFGPAVNRRFIRIAENNQKTSSQVFRQQAIATVAGVIRLYEDLESLIEDVKVKEETLATAERLYEDNHVSVQQGTLAPVELTRAEAGVAAARQDLANSRGYELQQELIVKTILTKRATADPAIRSARLVPTTPIELPAAEPTRPVEDMVAEAFRKRPEMEEARLQIQNSRISLIGSRNELLPELDLFATAQNSGLSGQANASAPALNVTSVNTSGSAATAAATDQTYIGGLGSGVSQIFTGRFPTYSVGIQLNLPLRNRIAQADVDRDELTLRQWQVQYQQLENSIRLEVEGAVIALNQARSAYEAAADARKLQEQSLAIEMERYQTGLSTTFLVMQYQSFVAQARSTEVAARGVYAKARTALERALGETLENHDVTIDEAYGGRVSRPPSAMPPVSQPAH